MQTRVSDPDTLAETLHATISDLDRFIDTRARELAAPLIAAAEVAAHEAVSNAQTETERQAELVKELRRQITALENQLDDLRVKHGLRRDVAQRARTAAPQ